MSFNRLTTDSRGRHYLDGTLLTPELLSQETRSSKNSSKTTSASKFRLLTVRRLTSKSQEELYAELMEEQDRLEQAALSRGEPTPFPLTIEQSELDPRQAYGVYVDEDINQDGEPIFTFVAASPNIKAFIVSTGIEEDEYVVHLAYLVHKELDPAGLFVTIWRLVTLESNQVGSAGVVTYSIDATALPEAFRTNLDIDSIQYLGGGTWTALAIDRDDRLPVYGVVYGNDTRYKPIGQIRRYLGESAALAITNYSLTPTYSMTWNRGVLSVSKRSREFKQEFDSATRKNAGVIKFTRHHSYELNLCERPEVDYPEVVTREYVQASATYVGSTNASVNSPFQSPDYGTDVKRFSMASYSQESNILRPKSVSRTYNLTSNKHSRQSLVHIPILVASKDMSVYLRINQKVARGNIEHPNQVKRTRGKRGISYYDQYPYWWTYGEVLSVVPTGDTSRYRLLKSPIPGGQDRVRIGNILDSGEVRIDPVVKNRVECTWPVPANPPSGYFGIEEGSVNFIITYDSPPLIGHQGVYYYELQPTMVGLFSDSYNRSYYGDWKSGIPAAAVSAGAFSGVGATPQDRQNSMLLLYSQLLGGLGGGAVPSLNIGNVTIASRDSESIVVSDPNPSQKAALKTEPSTFPVGFFESNLSYGVDLDNNNQGVIYLYSSLGELSGTMPLNG